MKQFIASIYLVCIFLCGWTFNKQTQILLKNQGEISACLSSGESFFSNDFSYRSNFAINNESSRELTQESPSFKHKFPFLSLSAERSLELTIDNKTSAYLLISKGLVILFEGHDIIHPFNYFW